MTFHRFFHRLGILAAVLCGVGLRCGTALALRADEILLITNKNSPDSQRLAQVYIQLRNVPADQVVALDLPIDEEMAFDTYETHVVGPVRQFMVDHQLQTKVKCLLTFYGVPFRIRARQNTPAENQELLDLRKLQNETADQIEEVTLKLEAQAGELDPAFRPGIGETVQVLLARAQAAMGAISARVAAIPDKTEQLTQRKRMFVSLEALIGVAEIDARFGQSQMADPNKTDSEREALNALHRAVMKGRAEITKLDGERWDSEARAKLIQMSGVNFGLVGSYRVMEAEMNYLKPQGTGAATDNELALLWLDYYPRQNWLRNPLNYEVPPSTPQALMVMRLDAPDAKTVEHIMRTSVEVEKTGLKGIIALDARGLSPTDAKGNPDPFGEFDEKIRNLAFLIRAKTDLKVRLDDQEAVFPAHSVQNVALYCGWYSVNQYIPGCDFNPGAIGYHISSYSMVSLHGPTSQWVHGLLNDGVAGTLGAVAEPYLTAFPRPDEFFPLLLTGKLTLAEVYWKTTPMASWMISFIGDPLYTPYKMDPAMKAEDLPPRLRRVADGLPWAAPTGTADSSHSGN